MRSISGADGVPVKYYFICLPLVNITCIFRTLQSRIENIAKKALSSAHNPREIDKSVGSVAPDAR